VGGFRRKLVVVLIANDGLASMAELKGWCYPGREHRHWHYEVIREALARLGARPIGRSPIGRGRPGIWSIVAIALPKPALLPE
jgi:hypothetical protein